MQRSDGRGQAEGEGWSGGLEASSSRGLRRQHKIYLTAHVALCQVWLSVPRFGSQPPTMPKQATDLLLSTFALLLALESAL